MWKTAMPPALRDRRAAAGAAKKALLLALLVHLFGLVSVPEYKIRIRAVEERKIETLELPPELTVPLKERPEIPRPVVPIEAEDDVEVPEDVTIAETILDAETVARPVAEPPPMLPAFDQFVPYDSKPEFIHYVTPDYPELARKAGVEGSVSAKLLVGTDGRVLDVRIMSGPKIFHDCVRIAAMASLLAPAKQRDKPVAVWIALPYRFTLRDAG
ncbi:MAG: energy transducer TonB [Candidatus Eisenbacteria bacterium]|jgi:protein TonB|nr:energy transducer TonB [Candidatus Eisenbacteria bacterium]